MLILNFGFVLDLEDTFYVPSFFRNLISIFKLTNIGFGFHFENSIVNLIWNKGIIGIGLMLDGLDKLDLNLNFEYKSLIYVW